MINFRFTCSVVIFLGEGKLEEKKIVIDFNLWKIFKL